MNPLLQQWRDQKDQKEEENFLFLTSLKMRDTNHLQVVVDEIHDKVFSEINCLDCGNCCKTFNINLTKSDCKRISTFLGKDIFETIDIIETADDELMIEAIPCPFLGADNACSIYEVRPEVCRDYPHFRGKSVISRRYMHSDNTLCLLYTSPSPRDS